MAFTDVEMAILAQLAYAGSTKEMAKDKNPSTAPQRNDSLYDLLVENEVWLREKLGGSYSDALNKLKIKTKNAEYIVVKEEDDKDGSGFAAMAIRDPDKNVTVATRGTEGFNFDYDSTKDVVADIELAYSISTSQQEKMEAFMRALEEENEYEGYYFTGHSLGGNLANYGAMSMKPISKVKGVVTFNAPGFNEALFYKYAAEISVIHDRIINYQNEYDSTSSIMYVPGNIVIVDTSDRGAFNIGDLLGFDDHGINCLTVNGDGFAKKRNQVKGIQTTVIHSAVEWIRNKTGIKAYTTLLGIIEMTVNLGRMAVNVLTSLGEWFNKNFGSRYSTTTLDPQIRIDTAKLRGYAERLGKVNQRLTTLDGRMDDLYFKVGLRDLFNLIHADLWTGSNWRITNCAKYLNETANDFEGTERNVVGQFQG